MILTHIVMMKLLKGATASDTPAEVPFPNTMAMSRLMRKRRRRH